MQNIIIRGTTPTLKFTFKQIDVADIAVAVLSIDAQDPIEKDLSAAVIGEDNIAWTLTQAETLSFGDKIEVMMNWLLEDGTRGASNAQTFWIQDNLKEVVINV